MKAKIKIKDWIIAWLEKKIGIISPSACANGYRYRYDLFKTMNERSRVMAKEIHEMNSKATDFVAELIDYIFAYPDDDYMTMECLCRKLYKHGLIERKDGEWTCN